MRRYTKPTLKVEPFPHDVSVDQAAEFSVRDEAADIGATVVVAIVTGVIQGAMENSCEDPEG